MVSGSSIFSLESPESAYLKEKMRGGGGEGADKILGVLALINWLTFCPVCWLTGCNIRMEHERRTDICAELRIAASNSWWLICSFQLTQAFCYSRKSMKCKYKAWSFTVRPIYKNDTWHQSCVGVVICSNSSHVTKRLLSCGDAVNANWGIERPCITAGLETVQPYWFLQVTARAAFKLSFATVAGEKRGKL